MSGGGWGCPHETGGLCNKVNRLRCDPGMKGCELFGRYAFFDDSKNARLRQKTGERGQGRRPSGRAGGRRQPEQGMSDATRRRA